MEKTNGPSPAAQLLRLVWEQTNSGMPHSWTRLNQGMRDATLLACNAGFKFHEEDFETWATKYRMYKWGGNDGHMLGEVFYTAAVTEGNLSACKSFEAWKKRPPFYHHGKRVALASRLQWYEKDILVHLQVTSFSKNGTSLTACSWSWSKDEGQKLDRRITITREELAAEETVWKAQQKFTKALDAMSTELRKAIYYKDTSKPGVVQELVAATDGVRKDTRDLAKINTILKLIPLAEASLATENQNGTKPTEGTC